MNQNPPLLIPSGISSGGFFLLKYDKNLVQMIHLEQETCNMKSQITKILSIKVGNNKKIVSCKERMENNKNFPKIVLQNLSKGVL